MNIKKLALLLILFSTDAYASNAPVTWNSSCASGIYNLAEQTCLVTTGSGGVSSVTASAPVASSGGANPNITISQSNSTTNGFLSSADWVTFNAKQNALTLGNLTDAGTDGIAVTNGTGAVVGTGTSLSQQVANSTENGYLSFTDWNTFNGKQSSLTFGNFTSPTTGVSVTGGTGAVIGTGTSLSIQTASGTQPGLLDAADWTTFNSKQSALPVGTALQYLRGDLTDQTLNTTVVPEGANLYFTNARAQAALSVDGAPDPLAYNSSTGVFSMPVATAVQNGYLSSADWTTFNSKQAAGNYITALTGDVVAAGPGSATSTIQSNVVTNGDLAQAPTLTLKGNNTGSTANVTDLTVAQVNSMLGTVLSVTGTAPIASTGGANPVISIPSSNLTDVGTDGIAITGGTGAVIGTGTSIAQQVANSTQNGYLSSADWTTFNNKLNNIPYANTAFVTPAGNDGTCIVNSASFPCQSVAAAMNLFASDTTDLNQIVILSPGTFSIDGLDYLANVTINCDATGVTNLDFGNSGITMDSSWSTGQNAGGVINCGLMTSGSAELAFDFSSFVGANNTFNLFNLLVPGNKDLELFGEPSTGGIEFQVSNVIQNKGNLDITDASAIVTNYTNQNDGLNVNSTGSNGAFIFSVSSNYLGAVDIQGNGSGESILYLLSGSIIGEVTGTGNTLAIWTMGVLSSSSNINFTAPAAYDQSGDAGLVPYIATVPANWPGGISPATVTLALDDLAAIAPGGLIGVPNGGTGDTTFTANLPILGNGTSPLIQGTVSGNTTEFATSSGAYVSGDCINIDVSGNLVDAGFPCGNGATAITSVALTTPAYLTVTGSPITSGAGTLVITGTSEAANEFLASPNGSPGALAPRPIVVADIPTLNQNTTGSAASLSATLGVPTGGTGDTTFTANLPILGNGTSPLIQGTVSGNTTEFATSSGAYVNGDCINIDTHGNLVDAGFPCGNGSTSITSVALTTPAYFTVTGSPITSGAGTLAITGTSEPANEVLATPNGSTGALSPRALVAADLPATTITNGGDGVYTVLASDQFIRTGTTLTAARTYTLDACTAGNLGERHRFKNIQTQTFNLTVAGNGSDTVDYVANYVLAPGGALPLICAVAGEWDIEQ